MAHENQDKIFIRFDGAALSLQNLEAIATRAHKEMMLRCEVDEEAGISRRFATYPVEQGTLLSMADELPLTGGVFEAHYDPATGKMTLCFVKESLAEL